MENDAIVRKIFGTTLDVLPLVSTVQTTITAATIHATYDIYCSEKSFVQRFFLWSFVFF